MREELVKKIEKSDLNESELLMDIKKDKIILKKNKPKIILPVGL